MANEKDEMTRRDALKGIGLGVGVIATLPVVGAAQTAAEHDHMHQAATKAADQKPQPLRFFNDEENRTVLAMSEHIIPADDSSPGAKAARVNEYIDLVISESPDLTKQNWREGLAAINNMSRDKYKAAYPDASAENQIDLLKQISKNEKSPSTVEERFFRTIKNATIDGYYTSEIGIHQELHYKGNSYLKEFKGCTHPEHQS